MFRDGISIQQVLIPACFGKGRVGFGAVMAIAGTSCPGSGLTTYLKPSLRQIEIFGQIPVAKAKAEATNGM